MSITFEELMKIGKNKSNFEKLFEQMKTSLNVIPFIEAGMSVPQYPMWREFLLSIANETGLSDTIENMLDKGEYEEAAEKIIDKMGTRYFNDGLEDSFRVEKLENVVIDGAVSLLPSLFDGLVITTNFDRLLEEVYRRAGNEFKEKAWGAMTSLINDAISQDAHYIIKLHGDVKESTSWIVTLKQYESQYGKGNSIDYYLPIPKLLKRILGGGRTLLFLGSSLKSDRTVSVLYNIAKEYEEVGHYAIVEKPDTEDEFYEKQSFLYKHGIRPIWYPHKQHQSIKILLEHLPPKIPSDGNLMLKDDVDFVITTGEDTTPTPYFTGRENELRSLREHISSMSKLMLVSGMGGIGKTHLCRYLYHEYADCYKKGKKTDVDYIGYLNYYGTMDDTLVNGLKFNKTGKFEDDVSSAWNCITNMANRKRLLLIVDNVTNTMYADESLKKMYGLNCAVVLTSRLRGFERFKPLNIDTLPFEKCMDIFKGIYGDTDISEQEDLNYILSILAARHTKTVELLAYIARNKGWIPARLRHELEEKRFNLSFISISEGNKTTLQLEYEKLFYLTGLSENEINILEAFSIMPPFPIAIDICNDFFNADAKVCEDDEIFNTLHHKGWLQRYNNNFSMHPVIAEFIFTKQNPLINNHQKLAEACCKFISINSTEVFTRAFPFIPFAESVVKKLYDSNVEVIGFLSNQI